MAQQAWKVTFTSGTETPDVRIHTDHWTITRILQETALSTTETLTWVVEPIEVQEVP